MQRRKTAWKAKHQAHHEQTSTEARIIALEAQLRIYSQPEKGDVKLEGETPETVWGRTRGNPAGIFQSMVGNCE